VSYKREVIDVRVSRRVLWVGEAAYPLQNIARAQRVKLVPKRGAALRSYVKFVLLWMLLGAVAAIALSAAGLLRSGASTLAGLVIIAVPVLIVVRTIRLIGVLLPRKLYALIIETAGTPRAVLVSADENQVLELVRLIMDAIDNQRAEFHMRVETLHVGDKIQQFGNQNVGKVAQ
jgi:hypothetical protein